jgi:ankyrin repeat protein
LKTLPKTLDDTYRRIVSGIDDLYMEDAVRLLLWLTYSKRTLRLDEIAEVTAVNRSESLYLDPACRLSNRRDILAICSSLISISNTNGTLGSEQVRLAHASVRDFLVSGQIQIPGQISLVFEAAIANGFIAKCCLAYLLSLHATPEGQVLESFPLRFYAAEFWTVHLHETKHAADIRPLALELLQRGKETCRIWIQLHDPDRPWREDFPKKSLDWRSDQLLCPLYYASLAGLDDVTESLIANGEDVNEVGGAFNNSLQAASFQGHDRVVSQLLRSGAKPNMKGGRMSSALIAAAHEGHYGIVKILLDHYPSPQQVYSMTLNTALVYAAANGHDGIVQLLIEAGCIVNDQSASLDYPFQRVSPLQAAVRQGHLSTVRILVSGGAQILPYICQTAATYCKSHSVIQFLCDNGPPGTENDLVVAAARVGMSSTVQSYFDLKVNRDPKVDRHETESQSDSRLVSAAANGMLSTVTELRGRDSHNDNDNNSTPSTSSETALLLAAANGHLSIINLVLDRGTSINCRLKLDNNDFQRTALELAAANGHISVVRLLLKRGADINLGSPLQAAARHGHLQIAELLLNHSTPADANAKDDEYGTALQAATLSGNFELFKMILEATADVNADTGYRLYGTALKAAAAMGHKDMVQLLLDRGADVTKRCRCSSGSSGSALCTAISLGHLDVVELLLKAGAKANEPLEKDSLWPIPLTVAIRRGNVRILDLMFDHGATIDYIESSLVEALNAEPERIEIVQTLIDHGANLNVHFDNGFHTVEDMFPLLLAVRKERKQTAMKLILGGANVDEFVNKASYEMVGWNTLHEAARKCLDEIVAVIIQKSPRQTYSRLENGNLPIHTAAAYGSVPCLQAFLDHGADINVKNEASKTPLHLAADAGQAEAAKFLINRGASIFARDNNQMTPQEWVAFNLKSRGIWSNLTRDKWVRMYSLLKDANERAQAG